MSRWTVVFAVACGGGGGDGVSDNVGTDGGGGGEVIEDLCASIPVFDLDGKSCDQVISAFHSTMDAAVDCNVDADCLIVSGTCETFTDAFCSYAINTCSVEVEGSMVTGQGIVSAFANRWAGCPRGHGCQGCPSVTAACIDNQCEIVE